MHVIVAQPEVMPDLVDQHVADQMLEGLVAAREPFVEDGFAEQPDPVGQRAAGRNRLLAQRHAFIQPGEIERIGNPQRRQRRVVGKVLDPHHHFAKMRSELRGEPRQRAKRQRELFELDKELQRRQREFREDLNQRTNEERTAISDKATKIIKQLAQVEGFDIVLQDAVWANPRIDITEKVLKALDK